MVIDYSNLMKQSYLFLFLNFIQGANFLFLFFASCSMRFNRSRPLGRYCVVQHKSSWRTCFCSCTCN